MSQQSIKVLVIGSVNSRFAETFKKVSSINNKHGPFDVLLCTGNFFQSENDESELISLMQGNIEVPITTYFITGDRPLPTSIEKRIKETDGEVCTNLFYLGKQGILTTAQGLKIAFMSGSFNKDIYNGTESSTGMHNNYLSSDIKRLQSTRMPITTPSGVDILLTYEWPSFITNGSNCSLETPLTNSSTPIAELAAALKPRYHFAASENVFYEREPYSNITGFGPAEERPAGHVSRFVGLADVLNPKKQRWFYAFNLIPMGTIDAEKLCIAPNNTTPCPFNLLLTGDQGVNAGQKRSQDDSQNNNGSFFWGDEQRNTKKAVPPKNYICNRCKVPGHFIKDCPERANEESAVPPENYVCRICNIPGHFLNKCPQKDTHDKKSNGRHVIVPDSLDACWFCLANPKLAKHLIASIGTQVYATLAKGPLVMPGMPEATVPGGGHILLIPITHYPTLNKIPGESRTEVIDEMEKYKMALKSMYDKYNQDMVVIEMSRESISGLSHAHVQVVAVPKNKSENLENLIKNEFELRNMAFVDQVPNDPEVSYFKIDIPNGKSFVYIIPTRLKFNMQFGRLLLAKALGHPEREDWKACSQTIDEERNATEDFKKAFKSFDFTI